MPMLPLVPTRRHSAPLVLIESGWLSVVPTKLAVGFVFGFPVSSHAILQPFLLRGSHFHGSACVPTTARSSAGRVSRKSIGDESVAEDNRSSSTRMAPLIRI